MSDDFLNFPRKSAPKRPVDERLDDYREVYLPRDPEVRREQASRCMDCGVPFCHQGCPLGNPIPDFNAAVAKGDWKRAWRLLSDTNNFPEFTGRICPAPCEGACVLAINDDAVTIEQIEKEISERAWEEGWEQPRPAAKSTGKKVAVVGSGPAGLAAAQQLVRAGHEVVVYERDDAPGGLLRYGIPDFKLDKAVLDRRLEQLRAEGVRFTLGVEVGRSPTFTELRQRYDAVLLATGAMRARDLRIPGRELQGITLAMPYLTAQNRRVSGKLAELIDAGDKHVIVLGGGDTGSDCVGTANRQGAASVRQIELFPAPPAARSAGNPWPQWPMVFRTSTSHEEGAERDFALMTTAFLGHDGAVTGLEVREVAMRDGQPAPIGEPRRLQADLVILALGFTGPLTEALVDQLGVALDARGAIATTAYRTSVDGVYAAGDARRGASLVVWALAEGREAARTVDADLMGRERIVARGQHLHFGGR
ncbi:MAG: glutamate synthase subunit beta [Deltaproteobacteria bacterium]|nr:MAG: glutamate synthase subunit beta [Deltaproteobacteria bacterium]